MITKQVCFKAMLRKGLPEVIARETTEANFQSEQCPTCPEEIDIFHMNTITGTAHNTVGKSHEHFRSTGIRDPSVSFVRWDFAEARCLESVGKTVWSLANGANICLSELWDREVSQCRPGSEDEARGLFCPPTSDVAEDKRPVVNGVVCGSTAADSGAFHEACGRSQLHGAIAFLIQAFSTLGMAAELSRMDYRNLWTHSIYPPAFALRSPSSCITDEGATDDHFGCQVCLEQITAGEQHTEHRYCKCMLAQQLETNDLNGISEFQTRCTQQRRSLQEEVVGSFLFGYPPSMRGQLGYPPSSPQLSGPPALALASPDGMMVHHSVRVTVYSSMRMAEIPETSLSFLKQLAANHTAASQDAVAVDVVRASGAWHLPAGDGCIITALVDMGHATNNLTTDAASALSMALNTESMYQGDINGIAIDKHSRRFTVDVLERFVAIPSVQHSPPQPPPPLRSPPSPPPPPPPPLSSDVLDIKLIIVVFLSILTSSVVIHCWRRACASLFRARMKVHDPKVVMGQPVGMHHM